mmetsp:Transcript_9286/g.56535  ORF Transcript_9286/g.56535 Transcript_9286/m.56535 type:complete len:249 (-) Transcript_9286:222-968(-)
MPRPLSLLMGRLFKIRLTPESITSVCWLGLYMPDTSLDSSLLVEIPAEQVNPSSSKTSWRNFATTAAPQASMISFSVQISSTLSHHRFASCFISSWLPSTSPTTLVLFIPSSFTFSTAHVRLISYAASVTSRYASSMEALSHTAFLAKISMILALASRYGERSAFWCLTGTWTVCSSGHSFLASCARMFLVTPQARASYPTAMREPLDRFKRRSSSGRRSCTSPNGLYCITAHGTPRSSGRRACSTCT